MKKELNEQELDSVAGGANFADRALAVAKKAYENQQKSAKEAAEIQKAAREALKKVPGGIPR